ncbi:MAG: AMP phosphorylase [Candidatus Aenigmatarchaeota archaeon]|nr:MAG: AMP phosphorylase [Candidatus Aenigmarchaeota archaeon]
MLIMLLVVRPLELEATEHIVVLHKEDAEDIDVKVNDRVVIGAGKKSIVAIVNVTESFVKKGEIGVYRNVQKKLGTKAGDRVSVGPTKPPESIAYIKRKLEGKTLKHREIRKIIEDIVENKLSSVELTAFVTSLYNHGMTMEETASMAMSMAGTGKIMKWGRKTIYDKHSIGGVPGDKTSMLLVPIVAAAGLTIPKTSSRAITAPAGTADKVECLCPVDLCFDEVVRVVKKTNGCLVWGGAVDLAPADDVFIRIEYPLSIDPLLLPSVMSKKKAVGANYVVIDIPTGMNVKIKTIPEAKELAGCFIELGRKLGMEVECVSTFGEQPIGHGIGPALEAREALDILMKRHGPPDLIDKVCSLAEVLFRFAGIKNPKDFAYRMIKTGKAEKKLREIIGAQGGDSNIQPEDIPVGEYKAEVKSKTSGIVHWINNRSITQIAREAGAPKNKGAGLILHKKIDDKVRKGETIFEIYAESERKLERALKLVNELSIMGIGKRFEMVLAEIPEEEKEEFFVLER